MNIKSLTQSRLKELYSYDSQTGFFTRLKRTANNQILGELIKLPRGDGYTLLSVDGTLYLQHRLIFLFVRGCWPDEIDHINHIRHDNRWCNLRSVTRQDNTKNLSLRNDTRSGICGVSWHKSAGSWRAYITENGVTKHLGLFISKSDAINARLIAELNLGFHSNHGS